MELDQALEFAVIPAWQALSKVATPSAVRIEYECVPGASLDHLSIWLIKPKGYLDLVYEHWAKASGTCRAGARFANGHDSDRLAHALNFILKNQDQFTKAADRSKGRILLHPPTVDEHIEAVAWMRGLPGAALAVHGESAAEGNLEPAQSLAECAR